MATARFAWGIDVGNRALKAVKLVPEGDRLRVDDFEVIEHEQVLSNSGDNRESLIQSALAQFVQKHAIKGAPVAVGVAGQQSFARFIKLPPVEDKKIPEIVKFEAIQQIPFPLDDVEWSYQLFRTPDSPDVEVGIFAMKKELIEKHISFFTGVDLNVQVVQMSPLAVYNAIQYDGRLAKGTVMIVDLGAENTDLIIADNDTVWLRSIPIGGNNFTEALGKAFKLDFRKAEELKRNAATSKYQRQIFQAMRPVFADMVAEIQRSIGFYASVHRESRIRKVIALGGTFRLPGLQKYLQQNLQLDVDRLDAISAGAPADSKNAAGFSENLLSMVVLYGLAIQALGEGKIQSSLLPARIRREKVWKDKTKWFALAAGLMAAGAGVAIGSYFVRDAQFNSPEAVAARRTVQEAYAIGLQKADTWGTEVADKGETDRKVLQSYRGLDAHQDVLPQIIAHLSAAFPVDANPILSPADAAKAVPRSERSVVRIDRLTTQFAADITLAKDANKMPIASLITAGGLPSPSAPSYQGSSASGEDNFRGPAPAAPPAEGAPAAGAGRRGVIVTIQGTTTRSPDSNASQLLVSTAIAEMNKLNYAKVGALNFVVERAGIAGIQKLGPGASVIEVHPPPVGAGAPGQPPRPAFGGPGGGPRPGRFGEEVAGEGPAFQPGEVGGPPGVAAGLTPPGIDRYTGESTENDMRFTIVVVVGLDPVDPAKQPKPE